MSDSIERPYIAASQVTGTCVYNRAGENLGSIQDLVIGRRDGRVRFAIMSFGGFLGIGEEYHPLPWGQLNYDEPMGGYVVALTRDQLDGAPRFARDTAPDWNDRDYGTRIDDYYGTDPGRVGV